MRIALASLNQKWEQKTKNFIACENLIKRAVEKKVDLIIFPEMTLTGFSMNISGLAENFHSSDTLNLFKSLAKKYSINIIFGAILRHRKKITNNAILVNARGEIKLKYKKIHLFSFAFENKFFSPGNLLPIFRLRTLRLALTICYDLRFPELFGSLAKKCNLIINIANWPKSRINHWYTLLTARAIENQLFVIGVNRTGTDGNSIKYVSSSRIICPDGSNLKYTFKYRELSVFDVDVNLCSNYRKSFTTIRDRKIKLYKSLFG